MGGIGSSMTPIYGKMFRGVFRAAMNHNVIDKTVFLAMLKGARDGVQYNSSALPAAFPDLSHGNDLTAVDKLARIVKEY